MKIDPDKIIEGGPESHFNPCENIIPGDAMKIFATRSYEFYKYEDKKTKELKLGVKIVNYHPGELSIPVSVLKELLKRLK